METSTAIGIDQIQVSMIVALGYSIDYNEVKFGVNASSVSSTANLLPHGVMKPCLLVLTVFFRLSDGPEFQSSALWIADIYQLRAVPSVGDQNIGNLWIPESLTRKLNII
jgi:predicted phage tail protein